MPLPLCGRPSDKAIMTYALSPQCRPTEVPDEGLLCDLLWSDPEPNQRGWGENDRGVSFTFGADCVTKFLNRHDLDLVRTLPWPTI